jgi:hypothetical protein
MKLVIEVEASTDEILRMSENLSLEDVVTELFINSNDDFPSILKREKYGFGRISNTGAVVKVKLEKVDVNGNI